MRTFAGLVIVALGSLVGACAGDGAEEAEEMPGQEDLERPRVVSSTPANLAAGVRAEAEVVIEFSEAMDEESVVASLDTRDLGEVVLRWNQAGDALTIRPVAELAYAEGLGTSPGEVQPLTYSVVLGTGASDLAGNPIEAGYQVQFTTLKALDAVFELAPALTGTATATEPKFPDADLAVGDDPDGIEYRAFMSFDISMLPLSAVEIESAVLATRQIGELGAPYASLGTRMQIDHLSFAALGGEAFAAAPHDAMGDFAEHEQVVVRVDVTGAVDDDRAHRLERDELSQFRLRFELGSDGDETADAAVISRELSELEVRYLVP